MVFDDGIYLEALDGFQCVCSLSLALWMAYILRARTADYRQLYFRAGVSIMVFHTGISIVMGWRCAHQMMENIDADPKVMLERFWLVPVVAALIAAFGISCQVRTFTTPGFGHRPWVIVMILGSLAVVWPFFRECTRVGAGCVPGLMSWLFPIGEAHGVW